MAMKFKQRDGSDCGPARLGFVADYYRLRLPLARIRQIAGTDAVGTTALGLIEAAAKLGFQANGVRGPFESLAKVPKPVIAHLKIQITFKHPGRTETLREVSLTIPEGKIIALIGESGSEKKHFFSLATTLVSVGFKEDLLWRDRH